MCSVFGFFTLVMRLGGVEFFSPLERLDCFRDLNPHFLLFLKHVFLEGRIAARNSICFFLLASRLVLLALAYLWKPFVSMDPLDEKFTVRQTIQVDSRAHISREQLGILLKRVVSKLHGHRALLLRGARVP